MLVRCSNVKLAPRRQPTPVNWSLVDHQPSVPMGVQAFCNTLHLDGMLGGVTVGLGRDLDSRLAAN